MIGSKPARERPAGAGEKIRLFEAQDLPHILKIESRSFGADAWPAELFEEYARSSPNWFLVAVSGSRITGYSLACVRDRTAELASIGVLPEFRGLGIASQLLQATLKRLRRQGVPAMWLMVRWNNQAAIQLYRKFGFIRTATVPRYYEDGASALRMHVMLK